MPANPGSVNGKDISNLFRSTEELEEPEQGIIQGEIPDWIDGTLFRTGPAKFDVGNYTMNHWLDGYALLSKFEIKNSTVKFHKTFLKSDALEKALCAGKPILTEFGTKGSPDPKKNIFSRLVASVLPVDMTDNGCVSIFQIGSDLFSTSDTNYMRRITQDLGTCEKYDTNKCFGMNGACAHPLREEDGTVYNIGFSCITGLKFNVLKIPGKGFTSKEMIKNAKIIASIPSRWSTGLSYNHSFGMTENYVIFIEQPYIVSFSKLAGSVVKGGTSFKDWLEWREEEKNRFIVIDKITGKIHKTEFFSSESFFFLHFINCYEEDGEIVVDVNAYSSPKFLDHMYVKDLRNNVITQVDPPCAQRFKLPLALTADPKAQQIEDGINLIKNSSSPGSATAIKTGSIITLDPEILTNSGLELPAINKSLMGKKHKYFYATGTVCENEFTNTICKMNLENKETKFWRESEFMYPGEPVFIPRPKQALKLNADLDAQGNDDEDDGVVISPVTDVSLKKDFLVFIDAKTWQEIGRASFNAHVPQALHGMFLESKK